MENQQSLSAQPLSAAKRTRNHPELVKGAGKALSVFSLYTGRFTGPRLSCFNCAPSSSFFSGTTPNSLAPYPYPKGEEGSEPRRKDPSVTAWRVCRVECCRSEPSAAAKRVPFALSQVVATAAAATTPPLPDDPRWPPGFLCSYMNRKRPPLAQGQAMGRGGRGRKRRRACMVRLLLLRCFGGVGEALDDRFSCGGKEKPCVSKVLKKFLG